MLILAALPAPTRQHILQLIEVTVVEQRQQRVRGAQPLHDLPATGLLLIDQGSKPPLVANHPLDDAQHMPGFVSTQSHQGPPRARQLCNLRLHLEQRFEQRGAQFALFQAGPRGQAVRPFILSNCRALDFAQEPLRQVEVTLAPLERTFERCGLRELADVHRRRDWSLADGSEPISLKMSRDRKGLISLESKIILGDSTI